MSRTALRLSALFMLALALGLCGCAARGKLSAYQNGKVIDERTAFLGNPFPLADTDKANCARADMTATGTYGTPVFVFWTDCRGPVLPSRVMYVGTGASLVFIGDAD